MDENARRAILQEPPRKINADTRAKIDVVPVKKHRTEGWNKHDSVNNPSSSSSIGNIMSVRIVCLIYLSQALFTLEL